MRILLPPSEAKARGGRGRPLRDRDPDLRLGAARARVLAALDALHEADTAVIAAALQLPPAVAADAIAANRRVADAPTTAALRRYAGVVYDGLRYPELSADGRQVAAGSVLVFSGLFGVVRATEAIPNYRVPAKAVLPGIGVAGTYWRRVLDDVVPAMLGRGLVVDLRSSDYAGMWRPRPALAKRVVSVRVLSPLPSGALGVVSYPSKFAKGQLCAALVQRVAAGNPVDSVEDVAAAWADVSAGRSRVVDPDRIELFTT